MITELQTRDNFSFFIHDLCKKVVLLLALADHDLSVQRICLCPALTYAWTI